METHVLKLENPPAGRKKHFMLLRILIAMTFVGAIGATVWWWFWGTKPRVVFTVPIAASASGHVACWPCGDSTIAVLGGGKLTLVDLEKRTELWQAGLPLPVEIDQEWQDMLSKRFLKLQQWSEDLAKKRASLKGDAATKAFNAEAAKYAADLAATRADAARGSAAKPVQKAPAAAPQKYTFGGDRSPVDKLKTIQKEGDVILKARIAKRTTQITQLETAIAALRPAATTPIKVQQLRDNEARLQLLSQEQKADEAGRTQSTAPAAAAAAEVEPEFGDSFGDGEGGPPKFAALGDICWLAEGSRVIGFNKSGGGVKTVVPMPGTVMRMIEGSGALFVVAHAGNSVRYVAKIEANGAARGHYVGVTEEKVVTEADDSRHAPVLSATRTEFMGGGTLAAAEIRLANKKVDERQAIKPGAEKAAEEAVQTTVGGGLSEAMAIMKVVEHDKILADTGGVERIDASTYQVSVRRPFMAAAPVWTGEFTGRVQCFSTPSLSLVTGGTKLVALDANNAKLWESTLGAPAVIGSESQWERAPAQPCIESGGMLFFFDRAVLTAFDTATGEVRWRLPSIGIRKVVFDGEGFLYVHSANMPAESLTYLSEMKSGSRQALMKVSPKDGTILWSAPKFEDVWASGKDVYSMRIGRHGSDIEKAVFEPGSQASARVKIYKLSNGSGKPRWEWFQARHPSDVIANGKTVAILFGDELQVIHSIAL